MLVPFNRRAYRLGIVNGIFAFTGSRVADPNTIVPLLIPVSYTHLTLPTN